MTACSANKIETDICPQMELLNQACLDLVTQIEELKEENTCLKKLLEERNGAGQNQRCRITPDDFF